MNDKQQKAEYISEDFIRKKIIWDKIWRVFQRGKNALKKTINICLMTTVMVSLYWTYQGKLTKDDWITLIKISNDNKKVEFLLERGLNEKETRVIMEGFFVNDANLEPVNYEIIFKCQQKDIKAIKNITNDITRLNSEITGYFYDIEAERTPKFSRKDILNKIITLKGELELLDKKYNIKSDAKFWVSELEEAYKTKINLL